MLAWERTPQSREDAAEIAYALQESIVETLFIKCQRALQQTHAKQIAVAGGVSANTRLREVFQAFKHQAIEVFFPHPVFAPTTPR